MAKRTGLGRGIGALIPTAEPRASRPADIFFAGGSSEEESTAGAVAIAEKPIDPAAVAEDDSSAVATLAPSAEETADAAEGAAAAPAKPRNARTSSRKKTKAPASTAAEPPAADAADPADAADASTGDGAPPAAEGVEQEDLVAIPGARLEQVDPHKIVPNPRQPRTHFDPDELAELVHSVREFGVLQPVVVRDKQDGEFELIMGERRTRAAREAGLDAIPAIVRDTSDENLLRDALLENLHRSELNPLEEASAYQQLLDDFGITQDELANRIGRSRPQISNTIRLLRLPVPVQQRVAAGVLSAGHARTLLSLDSADAMQRLADKIVNEDLSVRAAEAAAKAIAAAGSTTSTITTTRRPQAGARRAYLDEVSGRLGDRLNTKVSITLGARKGQLKVDFATIQDLNRILEELGESGYGA